MPRISALFWEALWVPCCLLIHPLRLALVRRVEGEIPRGPVLLAAKHASSFDITVLAAFGQRLQRRRPYFQMGSFVGYRILGAITPLLRRLGGFAVMRPKDVRRLVQRSGLEKREALEVMKRTNEEAEATRRTLLRDSETLVVFPEGTRAADHVAPLKATLEIDSALALVREEGLTVDVWPVVISMGRKRWFRRPMRVDYRPAFRLEAGQDAEAVLQRIAREFDEHWVAPEELERARMPG